MSVAKAIFTLFSWPRAYLPKLPKQDMQLLIDHINRESTATFFVSQVSKRTFQSLRDPYSAIHSFGFAISQIEICTPQGKAMKKDDQGVPTKQNNCSKSYQQLYGYQTQKDDQWVCRTYESSVRGDKYLLVVRSMLCSSVGLKNAWLVRKISLPLFIKKPRFFSSWSFYCK